MHKMFPVLDRDGWWQNKQSYLIDSDFDERLHLCKLELVKKKVKHNDICRWDYSAGICFRLLFFFFKLL